MLLFIAGLIVGSFAMLFTMSLMVAAKRGDEAGDGSFASFSIPSEQ
ncbi:hypothetical protein [Neobacillus bataviensis]|nr:hypothetical protein [Neobacillus bataviensis]